MITRITVHSMFLCEPLDHLKTKLHKDILYILSLNIFCIFFLCEPVDHLKIELHNDIFLHFMC